MKLYKLLLSYLPLIPLFAFIAITSTKSTINTPNSNWNQKIDQLNKVISLADIKFQVNDVNYKLNEVELSSGNSTIFISLKDDPYTQVATLQNIFKNANIKSKNVELIDLNSKYPYATLKDR